MTATELLEELLEFLRENLPEADVRWAWGPGWGSRLLERPVVSGQVYSHMRSGTAQETVLLLSVFAQDASTREETANSLETLLREKCPGCGEILREGEQEDSVTRLPCLTLRLTFSGESGGTMQGVSVSLGGKTYSAAAVEVSVSLSGEALVAVGEEVPFAVRDAQTEYQVTMEGVHAAGLERLAVFNAQIGNTVYTGCRWKKLDFQKASATFLAAGCEEKEESL